MQLSIFMQFVKMTQTSNFGAFVDVLHPFLTKVDFRKRDALFCFSDSGWLIIKTLIWKPSSTSNVVACSLLWLFIWWFSPGCLYITVLLKRGVIYSFCVIYNLKRVISKGNLEIVHSKNHVFIYLFFDNGPISDLNRLLDYC